MRGAVSTACGTGRAVALHAPRVGGMVRRMTDQTTPPQIVLAPQTASPSQPHPLAFLAAFGAGGLLSLMVLFNGTLALHGSLLFSSWVPHATGTIAALVFLAVLRPGRVTRVRAPLWAYAGGVSGAVTVMLTSYALNTPLALSGTLAIGLAGQMIFGLIADARGLFGLPQRSPVARDIAALVLIVAGSLILIFLGGA